MSAAIAFRSAALPGKALFVFHLCSLDATAVAVAWQLLFERSLGVPIHWPATAALAITVWVVYAGDRLMDVTLHPGTVHHSLRHQFHWDHKHVLAGVAMAALAGLAFVTSRLRIQLFENGCLLGCFVVGYFGIIHLLPAQRRKWFPKELAVGAVFAAGTCLAAFSGGREVSTSVIPGVFFAGLCCLNCAAIEVWEWRDGGSQPSSKPHPVTLWIWQHLRALVQMSAAAAALLLLLPGLQPLFAALLTSASAFYCLERSRHNLPIHTVRVLADLPLLSPVLFLGWIR